MWSREKCLQLKVPMFFKTENFRPYTLNMHGKISRITTEKIGKM